MFKKFFKFTILNHIFIFLICFLFTYTILNQTKMETKGATKVNLIVHASCNILTYANELYAYIEILRKKGIVLSDTKNATCTDFSLFRYSFTFKTSYFDYVNKSFQQIVPLTLEKKDTIKDELKRVIEYEEIKLKEIEDTIDFIKLEISKYDFRNNEIDGIWQQKELNVLLNEHKSLSERARDIKSKINSLKKILKFNGVKYEIDYINLDERISLGIFNNLFIISFFISILIYFFIILLKTVLPKKYLD